jgi:hypothetical protein
MTSFDFHMSSTPDGIREALLWFHSRRGTDIEWPSPSPVSGMSHVVTSAKGIYKPAGFDVALSVRQTANSLYSDHAPVTRDDGTWYYVYHQEGLDPSKRDGDFTNVALMGNMSTGSPVAVLIQENKRPKVTYYIQGLAVVTSWQDGYFFLEGFSERGEVHSKGSSSADSILNVQAEDLVNREEPADQEPAYDARLRTWASVVRRQGQGAFRAGLLRIYGSRCIVTGCSVPEALDAAHIRPYLGLDNGLLLRTDLHTLMDLGLLAFDPGKRTLITANSLNGSEYEELSGINMEAPAEQELRPSEETLRAHLDWCGDRLL